MLTNVKDCVEVSPVNSMNQMNSMNKKYRLFGKNVLFPEKKPIVYNMVRTDTGWRLTAYVPPNAPHDDRVAVVRWFGNYEQQVKREQPAWVVRFKTSDPCNYELDMLSLHPTSVGEKNQAQLVQNVETLWNQLSFDYA